MKIESFKIAGEDNEYIIALDDQGKFWIYGLDPEDRIYYDAEAEDGNGYNGPYWISLGIPGAPASTPVSSNQSDQSNQTVYNPDWTHSK